MCFLDLAFNKLPVFPVFSCRSKTNTCDLGDFQSLKEYAAYTRTSWFKGFSEKGKWRVCDNHEFEF